MIVRDSIVRHVRATLAEGKVHTHCFTGACVLNVSAQLPAILKGDESFGSVVLDAGVNDTKLKAEEGLQEPDRDGMQHIARDHHVRTSSHVSKRTRKVQ